MRKSGLMISIAILVGILDFAEFKTKSRSISRRRTTCSARAQYENSDYRAKGHLQLRQSQSLNDGCGRFRRNILNVGEEPAYLFDRTVVGRRRWPSALVSRQRRATIRTLGRPAYPPPPPDDPGLFIRLDPGHHYGVRERWEVKNIGRGRPGKYTLWVEYTSPVFRENVYDAKFNRQQMPYWFDFHGVTSNE